MLKPVLLKLRKPLLMASLLGAWLVACAFLAGPNPAGDRGTDGELIPHCRYCPPVDLPSAATDSPEQENFDSSNAANVVDLVKDPVVGDSSLRSTKVSLGFQLEQSTSGDWEKEALADATVAPVAWESQSDQTTDDPQLVPSAVEPLVSNDEVDSSKSKGPVSPSHSEFQNAPVDSLELTALPEISHAANDANRMTDSPGTSLAKIKNSFATDKARPATIIRQPANSHRTLNSLVAQSASSQADLTESDFESAFQKKSLNAQVIRNEAMDRTSSPRRSSDDQKSIDGVPGQNTIGQSIQQPEAPKNVFENRNSNGSDWAQALGSPANQFQIPPATEKQLDFSFESRESPKPKPVVKQMSGESEQASTIHPLQSDNSDQTPGVLQNAKNFVLAEQPKPGAHWKDDRPQTDRRANLIDPITSDFSPDAVNPYLPYDPYHQMHVYEGKTLYANQRPIVELGRPWYQLGQLSPGSTILGKHNPVTPQFLIYGDVRSAVASNTKNGNSTTQSASEVNLDFDLKLTSTERFHMFMSPLDDGRTNTGYLFDDNEFVDQFDADIDFGYFEGDLGAIVGGFTNQTLPFDLPFAVGVMPLVLQNGVWMEDAFLGVAATIPARNSPRFDISNMDITFFAGYDKLTSPAFAGDDSAARMMGMASFIEALNGYFEIDYAFLDDRTFDDRSYHNFGFGYTRRYGRLVSNSTRVIVNAGQNSDVVANTADGVLLLSENSLITGSPSTVVPYLNMFAGFDRPQSAARAAQAGGILRNTGILFESDGMTGYPTLDPTANDTFGGALGLNLLASDFSQQLVVEAAWLNVMGEDANRNAAGDQYGVGVRYQLPLTNALILRADGMFGFLRDDHDIHGVRVELRHKY